METLTMTSSRTPYLVRTDKGKYVTKYGVGAVHTWPTGYQRLVFETQDAFDRAKMAVESKGSNNREEAYANHHTADRQRRLGVDGGQV